MNDWTLTIGTTNQTLAAWGLTGCALQLASKAEDIFSAASVPASLTADPIIPHGAAIALYSPDGVCRFKGTSHSPRLSCAGGQWRWTYTCHGPWWDLAHLVFQQTWTLIDTSTDSEVSADGAELIFGMWYNLSTDSSGNSVKSLCVISTTDMLTRILAYAALRGLTIAAGTLPAARIVPPWTARDITCAAALESVLKWHPNAVTYFDYTTDTPTLHIVPSEQLPIYTIPLAASYLQSLALNPRHDLQIKGVAVRFKRIKLIHELKVAVSGGYEWRMASKVPAETTTYGGRYVKYEYVTETQAGDLATLPGVLIYSVDWTSYYDEDAKAEQVAPPSAAAENIFRESATLQYEGSVTLQADICPIVPWGQLAVDGLTLSGTAGMTGITYNLDDGVTNLSIGPHGVLGIDWVDLLARRMAPTTPKGIISASAGASANSLTDEDNDALEAIKGFTPELTGKVSDDGTYVRKIYTLVKPYVEP